jgi:DNA mismatch endonuclease, patch repair protein
MPDHLSSDARSENMRRIRSKNTTPEVTVRRALHRAGFRFRLNRRDLPGSPDIVLPKHGVALFVHGCFWHGHTCKKGGRVPGSNVSYWTTKLARNKERDEQVRVALSEAGWLPLVIWECESKDPEGLHRRLQQLLSIPQTGANPSSQTRPVLQGD